MKLKQIGVIHSPFKSVKGMPIQPFSSKENGEVEVFEEYAEGLKDIEGFSHVIIVYWFHKAKPFHLVAKPFLDNEKHGIFAIRHSDRPNPIGISTVKLIERKQNTLKVANIDILDGTPVLDIKPYVPAFDEAKGAKTGWLSKRLAKQNL
jgi:tRNA-Thr(GGU) m(6)t(6)A37 methyltransferase TsaA